jgi:hypothetical protein
VEEPARVDRALSACNQRPQGLDPLSLWLFAQALMIFFQSNS